MTHAAHHLTHLDRLESSGLIRLAQLHPELEYLFRHALVQEAAYDSLLKQDRKRLHHAIGHALEHSYPDRREELAAELARHFEQGDDPDHALAYYQLAGDQAARQFAVPEAADHYARALAMALISASDDLDLLTDLYRKRGRMLELQAAYFDALNHYRAMQALAEQRGSEAMLLAALIPQATIQGTSNPAHHAEASLALSERALEIARRLGDRAAESRILWNMAMAYQYGRGDIVLSARYGEESLAIARAMGLIEQTGYTLSDLAMTYGLLGQDEQAIQAQQEAADIWRKLNNLPMLAFSLNGLNLTMAQRGDLRAALARAEEALEITRSIHNIEGMGMSLNSMLPPLMAMGELGRAVAIAEECAALTANGQPINPSVLSYAILARIEGSLGMRDRVRRRVQSLLETLEARPRSPSMSSIALFNLAMAEVEAGEPGPAYERFANRIGAATNRMMAFLLQPVFKKQLLDGDFETVLTTIDPVVAHSTTAPVSGGLLPMLLSLRGCALEGLGRLEAAYADFEGAADLAETQGNSWERWRALLALAGVADQLGLPSEARMARQQARGLAEHMLSTLDRPDLREAFLNLPENYLLREPQDS